MYQLEPININNSKSNASSLIISNFFLLFTRILAKVYYSAAFISYIIIRQRSLISLLFINFSLGLCTLQTQFRRLFIRRYARSILITQFLSRRKAFITISVLERITRTRLIPTIRLADALTFLLKMLDFLIIRLKLLVSYLNQFIYRTLQALIIIVLASQLLRPSNIMLLTLLRPLERATRASIIVRVYPRTLLLL